MHLFSAATVAAVLATAAPSAADVFWVDWTSNTPSTATGSIATGEVTVGVDFSGEIYFAQVNGGTNYWQPDDAYLSDAVPNGPPNSDIIAQVGTTGATNTLVFDTPVVDPFIAIVSLGSGSDPATYTFDAAFDVVSTGRGFFGNGAFEELPDNVLSGAEGHGVIQFSGTFDSISWTIDDPETWHGFSIGIVGVPEPATGVMVASVAGLGLLRVRRSVRRS